MGVVQTLVCHLSKLFNCADDLEVVVSERNRRTAKGFTNYAKLLYDDAGIVSTVLDSGRPIHDAVEHMIPGKVLRLFQMDTLIDTLLDKCGSYKELLIGYQETLDRAVRKEGYIGVKCHLAEQFGLSVEPVSDKEAEATFPAAKKSNRVMAYHDGRAALEPEGYKRVYIGILMATLRQCRELGVPVHLHTGFTGGLWHGPISNSDPFLLVPLIRRQEFLQTKIILLHAGFPWMQNAAMLAFTFPHVWVDMSWATPWSSLRMAELYRDVLSVTPLSKVMFGSGGYSTPEHAWLAAKTSKKALSKVLDDSVQMGLLTVRQAENVGQMILYDNAARLYGRK
jgi:predicted TIM-barrel fold metal-dependent hydrolase